MNLTEDKRLIDISLILSILSTFFSILSILLSLYNTIKTFKIIRRFKRKGFTIITDNDA
jgi:uncharacterized membrane protein